MNPQMQASLQKLESTFDLYLTKKAPTLPSNAKDVLAKVIPYIIIIALLFSIPGILSILSLGIFVLPFSAFGGPNVIFRTLTSILGLVFLIPAIVLEFMALPGLFNRTRIGWKYLFYATLLNAVYNLISGNLVGLLIGTALSLYLLFQIKSLYR